VRKKFSIKVQFQTTTQWEEITAHGLLLAAWQFAEKCGALLKWEKISYPMKKVKYSPFDKLQTLWASVVTGCQHTVEINDSLGAHEKALARAVGLERFPDQSQVNRLLQATKTPQVEQWRKAHLELLANNSRARARCRWLKLTNREQMLVVDIDQRALAVRGTQFEMAKPGYFGRKRGRRGYQLSVAFLGGEIGEVIDEYLDPGDTQIGRRIPDLVGSLKWLCERLKIRPEQVVVRGDAQLGATVIFKKVKAAGFHFLFKGLSPQRAQKLMAQATDTFWRVKPGAEDEVRWMSDLGQIEHLDTSADGDGKSELARTLVMTRVSQPPQPKPGAHRKRVREPKPIVKHDYYLTDLTPEQLPVSEVLPIYDDRATIERYFYDEQYALGAQQVRTGHFEGEALFQLVVATTNNLLRWMQHRVFRQTELERIGLKRLVRRAMQIPARIIQRDKQLIVELPQRHHLVRLLQQSWADLAPAGGP
jgi:Transposase DDE domain group 1